MGQIFDTSGEPATPLYLLDPSMLDAWREGQDETVRNWIGANGFSAGFGQVLALPGTDGMPVAALFGLGTPKEQGRGRLALGMAPNRLPKGTYKIATTPVGFDLAQGCLAWLLGEYRFGRYKKVKPPRATLVAPEGVDAGRIEAIVAGASLTQTLINTPASDMGPAALQAAAETLAATHSAVSRVVEGPALLAENLPMIHAVGRAAAQVPRLIDLAWGPADAPKVTLVGKGVCFDTGGLNIKPGASMGLMKKDMGGAATVLGLAAMIMALRLPLRLRVLIPAVENSISAASFRPQDVLTARNGLTVEINNTDAEGRLVLADALALADEESPELMICLATLTGAARVAVGPDIAPFYCDDSALSSDLCDAARRVEDPVWPMPFWEPYEDMIEPAIADLDNAPSGGFAGSITAALFLRRFVANAQRFVHFDLYGWTPADKPGRPKGGACQAARALLALIETRYTGS